MTSVILSRRLAPGILCGMSKVTTPILDLTRAECEKLQDLVRRDGAQNPPVDTALLDKLSWMVKEYDQKDRQGPGRSS